ncbi:hypothetical protein LJR225_003343 [Phenylobacterium sp. LjRoot225]|uniref:hypothetical protein n=1 Tax=Phenylobacterium sp. LjRoot225 TaxID=3342285 RepID=UPI003ECE5274
MTLLEIATRAVCQEIGLHPDRWENFAHLSQAAFDAIAAHLPEDVRALFVGEEPRSVAGAAVVRASTITMPPEHGE